MKYQFHLRDMIVFSMVAAILCAIAFPLLQSVREKQRSTDCANRLLQFGISSHTFHEAYKRLPPGTLGIQGAVDRKNWELSSSSFYWARAQQSSALFLLTPFCDYNQNFNPSPPEMYNLVRYFDEMDSQYSSFLQKQLYPQNRYLPDSGHFRCPSDDHDYKSASTLVTTQPLFDATTNQDEFGSWAYDQLTSKGFGKKNRTLPATNFLANSGAHSAGNSIKQNDFQKYQGPMSAREKVTFKNLADSDGSANTIAFGENIGQVEKRKRKSIHCWFFGGLARGRGDYPFMKSPGGRKSLLGDAFNSSANGFGSFHPAGVNFAFCDARVQMVPRGTDWKVLYSMFGMNDGK